MELDEETGFGPLISSQISSSIVIYFLYWCSQVNFCLEMSPVALGICLKINKDVLSVIPEIQNPK